MFKKGIIGIIALWWFGSILFGMVLLLFVAIVVVVLSSQGPGVILACAPDDDPGRGPTVVQANAKAGSIPRNYFELYVDAGEAWNIPWNVLAGIGQIETHHGTLDAAGVHTGENFAGAGGPMQFLQSTFDRVKVDGNGNGVKSRYEPADAIYSAAKLLKVHIIGIGASDRELKSRTLTADEIRRSLFSYNHSWKYVNDVLAEANRYDKQYDIVQANYAGTGVCSGAMSLGSGTMGQRIANAAARWARDDPGTPPVRNRHPVKTPYSWGGGNENGPTFGIAHGAGIKGFDCSGLSVYAVYQGSNKKIRIARTTGAIWGGDQGVKVARDQLAPGDLVFFNYGAAGPDHMGVFWGEYKGERWMVEAPQTGDFVKFSKFDSRSKYVGAIRVTPPEDENVIRAMAPAGAGAVGAAA